MEKTKDNPFNSRIFLIGLLLIVLSTILFLLPDWISGKQNPDSDLVFFFINYSILIFYLLFIGIGKIITLKWKDIQDPLYSIPLLLFLSLISAFSLNRSIPIFNESADWLKIYIVVQCITILISCFFQFLPKLLIYLISFLQGTGIILYLYFSLFMGPYYAVGIMGCFVLGISLHVFVPLIFLGYSIYTLRIYTLVNKNFIVPYSAGILLPIIIIILFTTKWGNTIKKIERIQNQAIIEEKTELPNWVIISQSLKPDAITEKILKTGFVYMTPQEGNDWFFRFPDNKFSDVQLHDPLVLTASLFSKKINLSEDERIKMLEVIYDSRHKAQERLWSGDMLETNSIITNVSFYPEYRLAYTEKIITIQNTGNKNRSWRQQEALYTFHLPEGSVVTSLSLWINGKEEKGLMTSKDKADSAYRQIVGNERRDPSTVHWQEGNTVVVRVFPCPTTENRRFKIGITSPLTLIDNKLLYKNIWFDGPCAISATETVKFSFISSVENLKLPFSIPLESNNIYKGEKQYNPEWEVSFDAPKLALNSFSFRNISCRLEEYKKEYQNFNLDCIYLDINSMWTKSEFDDLLKIFNSSKIYVYSEKPVLLNETNKDKLYDQLSRLTFSLFPFNIITKPGNSILITKGTKLSPNVRDLKESEFLSKLLPYFKSGNKTKIFNLGDNTSPYLKTLKELRIFDYDSGNLKYLKQLKDEKKFVTNHENQNTVLIPTAGMKIVTDSLITKSLAPDHLLRLFTYNNIMKNTGVHYFDKNYTNQQLIEDAQLARVVTPYSSFVVLESQKDYEKFGIKDNVHGLKNASMKSQGAVPEPHEWMIILLVIGLLIYLKFKF